MYEGFEKNLIMAEASCKCSLQKSSDFGSFMSTGFNMLYYSIFSSSAKDEGDLFLVESDAKFLSKVSLIVYNA